MDRTKQVVLCFALLFFIQSLGAYATYSQIWHDRYHVTSVPYSHAYRRAYIYCDEYELKCSMAYVPWDGANGRKMLSSHTPRARADAAAAALAVGQNAATLTTTSTLALEGLAASESTSASRVGGK